MSDLNLTRDQGLAVGLRGSALLVSAAAGSGKTRVLVERLISRVTDKNDPRDIDSFLIITYTRAAAAELRGRIFSAVSSAASLAPSDRRLRRQTALCYRAKIGTIHSFCTSLLRENCHLAGLAPDFRVMDEDRVQAMKASVLDRLLERAYGDIERDAGFRLLVDTVGAGRDDARLAEVALSLHTKLQSHPDPAAWARGQAEAMDASGLTDAGDTVWGAYLLERARAKADYWAEAMEELLRLMSSDAENGDAIMKAYGGSIADTAAALRDLSRAAGSGWDAAASRLPIPFPRFGSLRNFPDEALKDRVSARRAACKAAVKSLDADFAAPSDTLLRDMERMRPAMERLLRLTTEFDAAYSKEKRRRGLLDFSDLEHHALRLLTAPDGGPTELARELSAGFTEVMADEYQDVNAVQDALLSLVSDGGRKLFMVGDVKQSIYRFRLADPGIFIGKYLSYAEPEAAAEGEPRRVLLRENFRSRPCVLDAANAVFSAIMSRELGEIDYDADSALRPRADYPREGERPVLLSVVPVPPADEEGDTPRKAELEAALVASQIRRLVDSGARVYENGAFRPAGWGDIVILLRSPGPSGGAYRAALTRAGIPVASEQGGGFFASLEVSVAVSLLAVIDNPRQDVPLISVLRSPFFAFTADELSRVRAAAPEADFYIAMTALSGENDRCRDFLDTLAHFRELAPDMALGRLLLYIYDALDMPAVCSAMEGGAARRENLTRLFEYARQFEEAGYRGLFRFTAWLRRLMERGEEPRVAAAEGGAAVRIMSVHKSKGLEFPFVFLADTGRQFNLRDLQQPVLIHTELGLGPKLTDPERGVEYPTLARRAVASRLRRETLSEEMRVLYVAMTRAKERLYVSCAAKEPEELFEKLRQSLATPLPPQSLEAARSPSEWLVSAALLDGGRTMELRVAEPESLEPPRVAEISEEPAEERADSALFEEARRRLEWSYPHAYAVDLPSKLTATELKGVPTDRDADAEAAPLVLPERPGVFPMPELGGARALTPAERGTAMHRALQYMDLGAASDEQGVRRELSRLADTGRLDPREAEAVDTEALWRFLNSPLGRRIRGADSLRRELRFSLLCPASDFFPGAGEDGVMLQGVVDCCFEEAGELTVVDYKTDRVSRSGVAARAELYAPQLRAYAKAVARMTGKPVRQAALCFLSCGETAEIKIS